MAGDLHVSVLTAEGGLFDGAADFVVVPGSDGELGILDGHVPLVATLKAGPLRVTAGGDEDVLFVSGGFVEMGREPGDGAEERTAVTVLADSGERAHDIDEARAEEARSRAQEMLGQRLSAEEYAAAAAALERSSGRIRVADLARRRGSRTERPLRA